MGGQSEQTDPALDKINGVVKLSGRTAALATDLIQAISYPPVVLSQALIECSSLRATFEGLAVLHGFGKVPVRIRSLLDDNEGILDGCTKALEDLGDLLEPLIGLADGGGAEPCGELPYIHPLLKTVTALRVIVSTTAGDQSKWLLSNCPVRMDRPSGTGACCDKMKHLVDIASSEECVSLLGYGSYLNIQGELFADVVKGTGQWFLKSEEFSTWVAGSGETLFCPGIFGSGKTMMTSIAINEVCRRFSHDPSVGVAFLYLDDDDACELYPLGLKSFATCLLRQFVAYGKDTPDSPTVRALFDTRAVVGTENGGPTYEETMEALQTVMGNYERTYIFVDSLHYMSRVANCYCGPDELVHMLRSLQGSLGTNLLCTSIPVPDVERLFTKVPSLKIEATTTDIELFLEAKMKNLPGYIRNNPKLQAEVKDTITSRVDGMFELAFSYISDLANTTSPPRAREVLHHLPANLEDRYNSALTDLEKRFKGESKWILPALTWVVSAKRPITIAELQHVMGVDDAEEVEWDNYIYCDSDETLPSIEDLLTACSGFLKVDEKTGVVGTSHWTVTRWVKSRGHIMNEDMAKQCLKYLSYASFQGGPCTSDEEFEDRLAKFPFYGYAATQWANHARHMRDITTPLDRTITTFFGFDGTLTPRAVAAVQAQFVLDNNPDRETLAQGYSQHYPGRLTGVHLAAHLGLEGVVSQLNPTVQSGSLHDSYGRSPLWYAVDGGHLPVVRLLMRWRRFDPAEPDKDGFTPMQRAEAKGPGYLKSDLVQALTRPAAPPPPTVRPALPPGPRPHRPVPGGRVRAPLPRHC